MVRKVFVEVRKHRNCRPKRFVQIGRPAEPMSMMEACAPRSDGLGTRGEGGVRMEVKPDRQMVAIHQWHGVDAFAYRSGSVSVHEKVIDLVLGVGGGVSPGAIKGVACVRSRGK